MKMPITIKIKKQELYDETNERFIELQSDYELVLEHSLISISKWESKWHKLYFDDKEKKSREEVLDYVRCMNTKYDTPDYVYNALSTENFEAIAKYIDDPSTATKLPNIESERSNRERLSSELLYYYMFKLNIPKDCEKWHINRLLVLLEIFGIKDGNENKKLSRAELIARNKAINAKNRARFNSKG